MKLTVYYDGQYWVGVLETLDETRINLKACRYIFGGEPADQDILDLVNTRMNRIIDRVSETVAVKPVSEYKPNPKRLAREAAKELQQKGISTYAQTAIQLERETQKTIRKKISREERDLLQRKKREIAVEKAKEKHRGH